MGNNEPNNDSSGEDFPQHDPDSVLLDALHVIQEKERSLLGNEIADFFMVEAGNWRGSPEANHPLSAAIERGFSLIGDAVEDRRQAVEDEAHEVGKLLLSIAAQARKSDFRLAKRVLLIEARHPFKALELLKRLDPEARPNYPTADKNGDPVLVGESYRWTPDPDNQGNEAGYYFEGQVEKVSPGGFAFGTWLRIGLPNPAYAFGAETDEPDPHTSHVPTQMLVPTNVQLVSENKLFRRLFEGR